MASFDIQWHDSNENILLWSFPSNYSLQDLRSASEIAQKMMAQSSAEQINIIIDMRGSVIDSRTGSMDELRKAYDFLPEIVQKLIFVSPSGFTQVLLSMMMTMNNRVRSTTYQVESVEDALNIINNQD